MRVTSAISAQARPLTSSTSIRACPCSAPTRTYAGLLPPEDIRLHHVRSLRTSTADLKVRRSTAIDAVARAVPHGDGHAEGARAEGSLSGRPENPPIDGAGF